MPPNLNIISKSLMTLHLCNSLIVYISDIKIYIMKKLFISMSVLALVLHHVVMQVVRLHLVQLYAIVWMVK